MTITADLTRYPLAAETQKYLESVTFGHVIDGEVVPSASGETLPIVEPSSGEEIGRAASGGPEDVERAVASARAAFDDGRWRFLAPLEKERRLRRLSQLFAEWGPVFSDLDVLDAGLLKPYTGFIVQAALDGLDYYAGWPTKIAGTIPAVPDDVAVYVVREPVGVVGIIVPWNGPAFVVNFVAAALACGNSVILKPAEQTPMSATLIGQLCAEAGIPAGVVNVLHGTGQNVGGPLVEHPGVDAIGFTGSVETGKRIQAAAAKRVKSVALELGGKSAHIVFDDADLDPAAMACTMAVWGASGQVCTAGTRVLVQKGIYDDFVDRMAGLSRDLRIGSPFDPDTNVGPVVSDVQLERIAGYVAIGAEEGATLALGGKRHGDKGYFFEPTIFTGVQNTMRIAQEEIFGPVMCAIPFETEEEAYRIANDTEYGLAAGVWTNHLARAHRAARTLRAGTVWVNTYQEVHMSVPYGGVKQSGHGRSLGEESIRELTQTKSVWMKVAR
ncbi:MAG TPA: aldehyde dehydrogenase family protein [Acidimicrobiales bacterium]|jgi:acyl-CoA reductase-like NAD-dependent aldehyde dehydrogenase